MGQATRTTKLPLDLSERAQGGANNGKRASLDKTVAVLNAARTFYLDFFLAYAEKFGERVSYYSEKHLEMRERTISANELLTWAESHTVKTKEHPSPWLTWNFSERFPDMPFLYRRSVIKDAIGKVRSYLSNLENWQQMGKKKGKPGLPGASNHPTLYDGAFSLEVGALDQREAFVRLKVYTGACWTWVNYPVAYNRYFEQRYTDAAWERQSPKLVLRAKTAELHVSQTKEVKAKKIKESKLDPDLVTVAIDLNVKNLAVITVRQHGMMIETIFATDHGLDQRRYQQLKRISKKQWLSGKPIQGEHSNQQLWQHIRRMNEDAAHKAACIIANVCAKYPGCVLLFERRTPARSPSLKALSPSKSIHMAPVSIAADAARRGRGSPLGAENASRKNGESCSGVRIAAMRPMPTSTRRRMYIIASSMSCIGNPALNGAGDALRRYRGRGRSLSEGSPGKD